MDPLENWAYEQDKMENRKWWPFNKTQNADNNFIKGVGGTVLKKTFDKIDQKVFNEIRDARIQNCIETHFARLDKFREVSLRICGNKSAFCKDLFRMLQNLLTPEILQEAKEVDLFDTCVNELLKKNRNWALSYERIIYFMDIYGLKDDETANTIRDILVLDALGDTKPDLLEGDILFIQDTLKFYKQCTESDSMLQHRV